MTKELEKIRPSGSSPQYCCWKAALDREGALRILQRFTASFLEFVPYLPALYLTCVAFSCTALVSDDCFKLSLQIWCSGLFFKSPGLFPFSHCMLITGHTSLQMCQGTTQSGLQGSFRGCSPKIRKGGLGGKAETNAGIGILRAQLLHQADVDKLLNLSDSLLPISHNQISCVGAQESS